MTAATEASHDPYFQRVMHGGRIQATLIAASLHVTKRQLASSIGVRVEALSKRDREGSVRTQQRLRDVIEILGRVEPWFGSIEQAYAWYRSQPLPSFGQQTAEDLVKQGQAEAVKQYLSRVAVGGYA